MTKDKDGKWTYTMEAGTFYSSSSEPKIASLHSGMRFDSAAAPVRMTYEEFLFRFEAANSAGLARTVQRQFLTMWMPASTTSEFLSYVLSKGVAFGRLGVHALNTKRFTRPMLKMPDEDQAFAVWLFHSAPPGDMEARSVMLAVNRELFEKMSALGGKRYPPYSGVVSPREWHEHYGAEVWRRLSAAKKNYDPNNVLTPGPGIFA